MTLQYRSANTSISTDGQAFEGYAVRWYDPRDEGTQYKLRDGLVERVKRGAFTKTLNDGHDIQALYHHKPEDILGRTSAGTLELREDDKGLKFKIPFDSTDPDHQRMKSKINNKSISGCSFGFRTQKADYGKGYIELTECYLGEISLLSVPAYEATEVALRSTENNKEAIEKYEQWEESRRIDEIINSLTNR